MRYEAFEGTIGRTVKESTPWWPTPAHARAGAPDVVVVLVDDLGFSHFGCYGSTLATPTVDSLAAGGVRFTNFHVTPLCSPTRAALLTGRNHHEVGMRGIANWSSGFPHMRGEVSLHAATMAEVLREAGYATFAIGKWHLVPPDDSSSAGPFDQWPLQRGFDRFYGFLDGETDQFAPDLVHDNHRVAAPATPAEGYHLSEDLIDHATSFIRDSVSVRPDRPFFAYVAFGATHAPHQAPAAYRERHRGRYDGGWDLARASWFARQRDLGIIGPTTELAPRNPGVEPWDSLGEGERRLAARLQEAFAAYLEHTDAQLGRLVDELARLGRLDNTVLVVMSDNGASQEGGPLGVLHEMKYFNGVGENLDEALARIDEIGGPNSHANYPWGWAQAGNTPFKWYKQNTHEGGVHVPLIVHWPAGPAERGSLRRQFHYVTDVAPTIYEIVGVEAPATYRGRDQMPLTGTSMAYALADAAAPSRHATQYFEMVGHRALYHEGWKAVTRHTPGTDFDADRWELYHVEADPSECRDLAATEPERLADLVKRWWAEASAHDVLPLDDRGIELFRSRARDHSPHPVSRHYTYWPPISLIPPQAAAPIGGRSWDLAVTLEHDAGDCGVLVATGTANAGLSVFVRDERLWFDYNIFGDHHVLSSREPLGEGSMTVAVQFRRGDVGGRVQLVVGSGPPATMDVPFVMRIISSIGMTIGHDGPSPVSRHYADAFAYSATIDRVDIRLVAPEAPDALDAAARAAMTRQ